jgi:hypothetical protein
MLEECTRDRMDERYGRSAGSQRNCDFGKEGFTDSHRAALANKKVGSIQGRSLCATHSE